MTIFRFILLVIFPFLTGCLFDPAKFGLDVFNPAGIVAGQERDLIITAVLLLMIVIVPVIIMVPIFSWRYRSKAKKEQKYEPEYSHNTLYEVIWWGVPSLIMLVLATITWITTHKLDPYRPLEHEEKPITIQVVALDWKWLFIYPEYNIATINFIQFPENVPVNFAITADAPMNSFAIPRLGGQIYAMQGMETKLHLIANKIGDFKGYSANYSGQGFSGMKFIARASTRQEFEGWVRNIKKASHTLSFEEYNALVLPSKEHRVEYFSSVSLGLYDHIISKFHTTEDGGVDSENQKKHH